MKDPNIKALLLGSILIMTAIPLMAAFYFLDDALQRSLNLGFNPQVVNALDIASQNLKRLKSADAENEALYREQFEEIGNLRHIYEQPDVLKKTILDSLKTYFGVGLVGALLASIAVALFLSRRISRSYEVTFSELLRHRDRVRYLEQMASWQELARILAHEIKNPLTPIEVLVTSLSRAHAEKSATEFGELLKQTESMVREEIGQLKQTVRNFGDFARLPSPQLQTLEPAALMREQLPSLAAAFETARIDLDTTACPEGLRARMDPSLFRQVFTNIVANGVEANPARSVAFLIRVSGDGSTARIAISNDGVPVPTGIAARMFEPYVSGKADGQNMGLGLAIVKKVVVEHGGEIAYDEVQGQPRFTISLPAVPSGGG
jgi:signal transduction histidine kinase